MRLVELKPPPRGGLPPLPLSQLLLLRVNGTGPLCLKRTRTGLRMRKLSGTRSKRFAWGPWLSARLDRTLLIQSPRSSICPCCQSDATPGLTTRCLGRFRVQFLLLGLRLPGRGLLLLLLQGRQPPMALSLRSLRPPQSLLGASPLRPPQSLLRSLRPPLRLRSPLRPPQSPREDPTLLPAGRLLLPGLSGCPTSFRGCPTWWPSPTLAALARLRGPVLWPAPARHRHPISLLCWALPRRCHLQLLLFVLTLLLPLIRRGVS